MMVEDHHHDIRFETLRVPVSLSQGKPPVIHVAKKRTTGFLSPTAINTYLRCPLRYYYKYECELLEPENDDDDTIDNRMFGNIFHKASQIIYERLMQKSRQILKNDIEQLLKNRVEIEQAVDMAIKEELGTIQDLSGLQIINRAVIIRYLRQLLEIDIPLTPFSIIGLECNVRGTIQTRHITTTIGGVIDRLDRIVKDGQDRIRVVDYKTGSHQAKPLANVEAIFLQENIKNHSDYYLQTLLYSTLVKAEHPQTPVSPALLFIQHAGTNDYDPTLCFGKEPIVDIQNYSTRFMELLTETVDQMFDPDIPYTSTDDRDRCRLCPYRLLCNQ